MLASRPWILNKAVDYSDYLKTFLFTFREACLVLEYKIIDKNDLLIRR